MSATNKKSISALELFTKLQKERKIYPAISQSAYSKFVVQVLLEHVGFTTESASWKIKDYVEETATNFTKKVQKVYRITNRTFSEAIKDPYFESTTFDLDFKKLGLIPSQKRPGEVLEETPPSKRPRLALPIRQPPKKLRSSRPNAKGPRKSWPEMSRSSQMAYAAKAREAGGSAGAVFMAASQVARKEIPGKAGGDAAEVISRISDNPSVASEAKKSIEKGILNLALTKVSQSAERVTNI